MGFFNIRYSPLRSHQDRDRSVAQCLFKSSPGSSRTAICGSHQDVVSGTALDCICSGPHGNRSGPQGICEIGRSKLPFQVHGTRNNARTLFFLVGGGSCREIETVGLLSTPAQAIQCRCYSHCDAVFIVSCRRFFTFCGLFAPEPGYFFQAQPVPWNICAD